MTSLTGYERCELDGLPVSFFLTNRQNFIKNLKETLTVLPPNSFLFLKGGQELYRYDQDDDLHYFLQESNFYYLTGILQMNYYAFISLEDASMSVFIPEPTETERIFMHIESLEDIAKKYNCQAYYIAKIPEEVKRLEPEKIYVLNGTNSDSGLKVQTCDYVFPTPYDDLNDKIDHDGLIYEILADTRTRKSLAEIDLLSYLNKVTVDGHVHTMKTIYQNLIVKGNKIIERDVENYFYGYTRAVVYGRNHPYEHICGCGPHGATLHYIENDTELKDGQLILMDMGVRAGGYVSDVTSTVPVNGKFSEKQKQIYDIVLEANQSVQKNVKPGVSWTNMHLLAENVIITGLQKLGLLSGDFSVDEMVKNRVGYYFMPHGLGHLMGIDTHDAGGYLSFTPERSTEKGLDCLRTARILERNMILSDEPGIYFIPYLLEQGFKDEKVSKYFVQDKIKEYYDFGGVRIEDDILITDNGCVNLTAGLPRTTDEIESAMTTPEKKNK